MLDQFCWSTEAGDSVAAARASAIADDYAQALDILKAFSSVSQPLYRPVQST